VLLALDHCLVGLVKRLRKLCQIQIYASLDGVASPALAECALPDLESQERENISGLQARGAVLARESADAPLELLFAPLVPDG
jgi:hypothetical protein